MKKVFLLMLLALICVANIQADFYFTNKTHGTIYLAFAYPSRHGGSSWVSEGWWKINPGRTVSVYSGSLTNRYYYYYAYRISRSGRKIEWTGGSQFRTKNTAFKIFRAGQRGGYGHIWRGFHKVDIGRLVKGSYTINLITGGRYHGWRHR